MTLQFYGRMHATRVSEEGWYRIRLRGVQAVNPGKDGAVWGTLRSGTCDSAAPMLYMVGLVEATAQPRDLVFDAWIQKGHRLELRPNDFTLRRPPPGATGGNVSYKGRDLEKEGYSGIALTGIDMERIHPVADGRTVARLLFGGLDIKAAQQNAAASLDTLVASFASRAFRRPQSAAQLAPYREMARKALAKGDSFPEALRTAYRAILCSPRFLTFTEQSGRLDDYALASRLSYALWVSMPDQQLFTLAAGGKLREPSAVAQQVDRMLADAKAARFVRSFTDQWLKLNQIDFTSPDTRQFPAFDPVLQESMLQETRSYIAELIRRDLPVTHLVESDFTFLNGRLARHYLGDIERGRQSGKKDVSSVPFDPGWAAKLAASPLQPGGGIQAVKLVPGTPRGGLLAQGAVLKVTADGTVTSPVVRGVFVNERILGEHIPPPPPGVPAIEPDVRGAVTIREQLDKHRNDEACAACHRTIDPPGFALENFDPVGNWRGRYGGGKGRPVDPSGRTTDGASFAGFAEWKALHAQRGGQLARGFAGQFLTYATGAAMRFSDETVLDAIAKATAPAQHGFRSILKASVQSAIFLNK